MSGWKRIRATFSVPMVGDFRQITKQMGEMGIPNNIVVKYEANSNVREVFSGIGRDESKKIITSFLSIDYNPDFNPEIFKSDMNDLAESKGWSIVITNN